MKTFILNFLIIPSFILILCCSTCSLLAQDKQPKTGSTDITGDWLFTIDYFNNPLEQPLSINRQGSKLSAHYINDTSALTVMQNGKLIKIMSSQPDGSKTSYEGILSGEEGSGSVMMYDPLTKDSVINSWRAVRLKTNRPSSPQRVNYIPQSFQRAFSATPTPVLHIWPDDIVHTESVDAGGTDKLGKARVMGGNPLTGPFYIETALPGDILAVTITRLRLNRAWAISGQALVDRVITNSYVQDHKFVYDAVRWNLDTVKGLASPEKPFEHMKNYRLPVKPMLGCVGVAPWFGSQPITTGDSGPFGGNMDFNQIVEGATVYLPVFRAGALLYLGDAHALQGDGELTGDALETSMDIEFKVKVIRDSSIHIGAPRVEDAEYIMAVGLSGSLDNAIKMATSELANWLNQVYKLTPEEVAEVLSTAIEYRIAEVADRNVGLVAKIKKSTLATLNK